jgi:hypothetical protein
VSAGLVVLSTAVPRGWCHRVHGISTCNGTNNFIIILYFNVTLNSYLKLNILYICKLNYSDVLCNTSLKEHLPEGGHNRWPKHVGYYATCYAINIYICTCWSYFS